MTILNPRSTLGTTAFILPSDLNDDWTYMAGSGHYRTADLKAALGIDELGCGCDEADDNLKAAIKRAEDAEAFGAAAGARAEEAEAEALEQAKLVRTWADRAEKYDHLANDLANELKAVAAKGDHWQERAENAEALVARVQRLRDVSGDTVGVEELDAILNPKPAFTLPTDAGAVIEYTDHEGGKQLWFRTRDTQRPWTDREGNTWHDAGLARDIAGDFTVLLGADQ